MDIIDLLQEGTAREKSITVNCCYPEINDLIEKIGEYLQGDYPELHGVLILIS